VTALAVIQIENLKKTFGDNPVLRGIDLSVNESEVVVIMGPSGSGKSTLLRCITFLEEPNEGIIKIGDYKVDASKKNDRQRKKDIREMRKRTGFVFQNFNLFPHKTAIGNVMEGPLTIHGAKKEDARQLAEALLIKVNVLNIAFKSGKIVTSNALKSSTPGNPDSTPIAPINTIDKVIINGR